MKGEIFETKVVQVEGDESAMEYKVVKFGMSTRKALAEVNSPEEWERLHTSRAKRYREWLAEHGEGSSYGDAE